MPRRIWAIADTHLSFANPKPMDIFGPQWLDHPQKIRQQCDKLVADDDLLLIPGDISWALKKQDAAPDLAFISDLRGIKVLCKGNHDYWWDSDRPLAYPGLHDTPFMLPDQEVGVAGTRGWPTAVLTQTADEQLSNSKIISREVRRLDKRLTAVAGCRRKVALVHYPPIVEFLEVFCRHNVELILYGHLHVGASDEPLPEVWHGIRCICVAADRVQFTPRLVLTLD